MCYYIVKIRAVFERTRLLVKADMHNFLYLALFVALVTPAVICVYELHLAHRVHVAALAEPAAADLPRMLPPALLVCADQLGFTAATLHLRPVVDTIGTFLEF